MKNQILINSFRSMIGLTLIGLCSIFLPSCNSDESQPDTLINQLEGIWQITSLNSGDEAIGSSYESGTLRFIKQDEESGLITIELIDLDGSICRVDCTFSIDSPSSFSYEGCGFDPCEEIPPALVFQVLVINKENIELVLINNAGMDNESRIILKATKVE